MKKSSAPMNPFITARQAPMVSGKEQQELGRLRRLPKKRRKPTPKPLETEKPTPSKE